VILIWNGKFWSEPICMCVEQQDVICVWRRRLWFWKVTEGCCWMKEARSYQSAGTSRNFFSATWKTENDIISVIMRNNCITMGTSRDESRNFLKKLLFYLTSALRETTCNKIKQFIWFDVIHYKRHYWQVLCTVMK